MNENKIYIDSLPCRAGWTTSLLLLCIVSTIASFICNWMNAISRDGIAYIPFYVDIATNIFWIIFLGLFANACRKLPHHISMAIICMIVSGTAGNICSSLYQINHSVVPLWIGCFITIITLFSTFWLGNLLSKNYSSLLGEIGNALKKIVIITPIAIIFILGCFPLLDSSGMFTSILALICAGIAGLLSLWILWIWFVDIAISIYQLLNWGHQEEVTQKDIESVLNR